jgi:hypothetical protein
VKSRILGTDGPFPRVSLRKSNLEKADNIVAIRWTPGFVFHDAVLLPKTAALTAYEAKRQRSGTAHINWPDWVNHRESVSLKKLISDVLR